MFGIGGWELLMIAVVALIVLGPKGLPAAARAIGRVVSELRRATNDLRQSIELDPELKDIPNALDELNRPLLSPSPYPRKRAPRDGPPPGLKDPPPRSGASSSKELNAAPASTDSPSPEKDNALGNDSVETTTTKPARGSKRPEPGQHLDESDGRDG